jgi:hypothetical protein
VSVPKTKTSFIRARGQWDEYLLLQFKRGCRFSGVSAQSMLTISNAVSVPVLSPGSIIILIIVLGIIAATGRRYARAGDGG